MNIPRLVEHADEKGPPQKTKQGAIGMSLRYARSMSHAMVGMCTAVEMFTLI